MLLDLGVVTGSLSPAGGGLFQCMRVPTNLVAQRGARVSVYGLVDDQFEQARSAWTVSKLQAFPITGPHRLGYSPEMMRSLVKADHDLVHLHGLWFYPSHAVNQWRRRTQRPTVISTVGMLDEWSIRQSWVKKRIIRHLYEDENLCKAAAIHANSHAEAQAIRKFGLSNPIAIIPNGVDLADLDEEAPLSLRGGCKTLLFLGRVHAKKGLRELVQAWALVRGAQPDLHDSWRIIIAGWDDGGHQAEIVALVAELDLGQSVSFLGPIFGDQKTSLLRHAHAFVLPSFGEGMPMAVLEAWSFALPVLMTKACNLTESFKANAAFEISMEPAAMANTLAQCLGDDAALQRVGATGRQFVATHYQWSTVVDRMLELYGWVGGGAQRPSFVLP